MMTETRGTSVSVLSATADQKSADPELAKGVYRWRVPAGTKVWSAAPNTSRYPLEYPPIQEDVVFCTNASSKVPTAEGKIYFYGEIESPPELKRSVPFWVVWDAKEKRWVA